MGDDLSLSIALSERERVTLTMFFHETYKAPNKAARKAMRLAFKRLKLDEIVDRLRKPGGINSSLLSDKPIVIQINEETINWVTTNLNNTTTEKADASLVLGELEDRFDDVKAGTYMLPPDAKPLLTSVPDNA